MTLTVFRRCFSCTADEGAGFSVSAISARGARSFAVVRKQLWSQQQALWCTPRLRALLLHRRRLQCCLFATVREHVPEHRSFVCVLFVRSPTRSGAVFANTLFANTVRSCSFGYARLPVRRCCGVRVREPRVREQCSFVFVCKHK